MTVELRVAEVGRLAAEYGDVSREHQEAIKESNRLYSACVAKHAVEWPFNESALRAVACVELDNDPLYREVEARITKLENRKNQLLVELEQARFKAYQSLLYGESQDFNLRDGVTEEIGLQLTGLSNAGH